MTITDILEKIRRVFSPRILTAIYIVTVMMLIFSIVYVRMLSVTIGYNIADISTSLVDQEIELQKIKHEYDAFVSYENLYEKSFEMGFDFNPQNITSYE